MKLISISYVFFFTQYVLSASFIVYHLRICRKNQVKVVAFVVEGGYRTSPDPENIQTPVTTEYGDVDNSYNDWGIL